MEKINIWSTGDEITTDTVRNCTSQFKKEIKYVNATDDEVEVILDTIFDNSTYYKNALEALSDYRENHEDK